MNELHTKHRPQTWDGVLGQSATVKSIRNALRSGKSRAFILTGSSGVGKTTIARLLARELGLDPTAAGGGYEEMDAATRTGVDDVRALKLTLNLRPVGASKRVICMDEAHMLTKNAWNALLKDVEEPPYWVYWVFCTTEPAKIPKSIRTRCLEYDLRPVSDTELMKLLREILRKEQIEVSDLVQDMIIEAAGGSPRALLTGLAKVFELDDDEDVEQVLATINLEANKDVADFCRALGKSSNWGQMMKIIKKMPNPNAEAIRIVVCAWFSKVAINARDQGQASRAVAILDAFGVPYPPVGSSLHPLLVSLGELLMGGGE